MFRIGTERIFTETELLENFATYLYCKDVNVCRFEIAAATLAAAINESPEFIKEYLRSRENGK